MFLANCEGEVPFYPEPGKYRALALPVDDDNLGVVIRTFGIQIPDQYSPGKKVEVSMLTMPLDKKAGYQKDTN